MTSAAQAAVVPSSGSGLVWTLKRGLPILVLVFAGMLYLGTRFTLGVNGQVQKCLPPYSFFLVDRHDDRLERGRILAFWAGLRMAPWFPPDLMVVKRLVGLPGDRIVVSADGDDGQRRGGGGGAGCGAHPPTAGGRLRARAGPRTQ